MNNDAHIPTDTSFTAVGLILVVIGVLGLAELAAHLPASARKLLLFSLAYGVVSGFLVGFVADDQRLSKSLAVTLTASLVIMGLLLIGYRSFEHLRSARLAALENASREGFDKMIVSQLAEQDPELMQTSFSDYLSYRVQPLGAWRQPWPVVFWGAELVLAAMAGAYVVRRRLTSEADKTTLAE